MKIVYLFNGRLPTEKAYGIQVAKMCEAFANNGYEVKLLHPYRKNPSIGQDIFSYYSIKNNFSFEQVKAYDFYWHGFLDKIAFLVKNYFSAKTLVSEALKENADIYYTRDELAAYLLSKKNRNVVFECHKFSNKRRKFYSHFKKKNLKLVAISNGLKEDLVKFGIRGPNILVAPDGVDLAEFNCQENKIQLREKFFSFHDDKFRRKKIAVYVGHLYTWKGADILTRVAENLKQHNDNFLIWIVGGTNKDIEILKKGMHPNIVPFIYINGMVPHEQVAKILKAADCAILTGNESETISAKYTSPLKMFEYMASGCPIIAQDLPSFREVLNENNSVFAKAGDVEDLADKIAWVFDDKNKELVEKIAEQAKEDVKNYTWRKRAGTIIKFLCSQS
ncbi:MAG: glycosyltransferase [Candidatus Yanofskybacteria bacterium]|nr:glycosyltransferase [Candidatus Yanofskybacteria bacterium]